jgi:lysophospholipase L1-like esterase
VVPPRRVLAHAGLVAAGLAGAWLLAEGVAGLLWQAPWYERLLAEQARTTQRTLRTNRLGLRGPEVALPKPPGLARVLVLGDSFTFGLGVDDDAATFPAVLERRLAEAPHPAGARVEVVNAGLPGSLTGDWVDLFERTDRTLDPDVVLAVFFLRDGTTLHTLPDVFGEVREELARRYATSLAWRFSFLYRRYRDFEDRRRFARMYTRRFEEAYFGSPEQTAEWGRAQRNLRALRDRARARGALFGLAVFPVLIDLDESHPFARISDLLVRFARENDIPVHDLLPTFLGRSAPDLWVSPLDQHPNEEAHRLAAASLLPFVQNLLEAAR